MEASETDRGFALLLVLWTMALLALLGAQVTGAGRAETRLAAALRSGAQLQAAADGAIYETIWHVLDGSGESRYRQGELTAKLAWKDNQQLVFSYVSSRAEGDQNIFDNFVGNYSEPFVRATSYANLPGDLPNRFLMWGHVKVPFQKFELNPTVEYRNGFPYTSYDVLQNYVGVPNSQRFPNFLSVDARLMRDFKVSKSHVIRLSVTGYNLTNHFNALEVHDNVADPQYGTFFGNYHRHYRFDFDIVY